MFHDEQLVNVATGASYPDDGLMLEMPGAPSLLRTDYACKKLTVRPEQPGIFRFLDWLPARKVLPGGGAPITYHSQGLGAELGLDRLYVTFSGYWPERGAEMRSGTFKECEAYSVFSRFPEDAGCLVVSSAGNTARAFIKVASENNLPLVVVVPKANLDALWSSAEIASCVRVVVADGASDYFDAIRLAGDVCALDGFVNEGGAKNVARRDGMGTTVLSAATTIGEIPSYYFQAIGSGTGAIAAHEANLRLNQSGDYSPVDMKLMLSQNLPFVPMATAWQQRSRELPVIEPAEVEWQLAQIDAKVLSNRQPPYGIRGGVFDCLSETGGEIDAISNQEARDAVAMFNALEGRDICSEAGVACASLVNHARRGDIPRDAVVMLNITGGGMRALREQRPLFSPEPVLAVPKDAIGAPDQADLLEHLCT